MNIAIIAIVFGVIFISELPDKSMVASLVLSTKFRGSYVWAGASAAFLVHVVIAVTAGQALTLLPHKAVELVVALLFLAGALLLFFGHQGVGDEEDKVPSRAIDAHSFLKVFGTTFGVIFLGEWGDITQIATANYAAHYHNPWSVGIGAALALVAVSGLAIVAGKKILTHINAHLLQRITGFILLAFAIVSGFQALK